MINSVVLVGRLCAAPELKKTQSGKSVCSVNVASDSGLGSAKKTLFIRVTSWNSTAEALCRCCHKGSLVGIEGELNQNEYTNKDGKKVSSIEVIARNIQFLEPRQEQQAAVREDSPQSEEAYQEVLDDSDLPF